MYSIDRKRYIWVAISALIQGLLLGEYLISRKGLITCIPLMVVVIVPVTFWLTQEHWGRRLKRFLLCLTLVLFIPAVFWLWNLYPSYRLNGAMTITPSRNPSLVRTCLAAFLLIPFFQCRIATWSWRVPYSEIFFQLCRNVFLLFQGGIVLAVFWGLLLTASLLFDILGLSFVPLVLFHPLVFAPLTSLTLAVSITVALKHPGVDSLGRWILSGLAWLLPPFSFLSLVFVACLPYSGLRTLWSTGQASSLILLLQIATILLVNAAWMDGTRNPFPNKINNILAQASMLCLPVYTAICLYSLGLRIQQYGLSIDRVHAGFVAIVTGIWGLGYAGAVVFRKWPSALGRINIVASLIMTLLVVLMWTPLLSSVRLSVNNQVARLLSGKTEPQDFDYLYMRFNLAPYGDDALIRLSQLTGKEHPRADTIRKRATAALSVDPQEYLQDLKNSVAPRSQRREILNNAKVYPKGRVLKKSVIDALILNWEKEPILQGVRHSKDLAFVFQDVTNDANLGEDLLVILEGMGLLIKIDNDAVNVIGGFQGNISPAKLEGADITSAPSYFSDLQVNGQRFQILATPKN